jgi:oligoribonuclease (3'-5' exoribonuclease)
MNLEDLNKIELSVINRDDLRAEIRQTILDTLAEFKNDKTYITPQETMVLLNVKKTKLQEIKNNGLIEYVQPSRKNIQFLKSSVLDYLRKHTKHTF